jgi:hypothetical protein
MEVKEKLAVVPRWRPDTRRDWPTDRRSLDNFDFVHASKCCNRLQLISKINSMLLATEVWGLLIVGQKHGPEGITANCA